jgi:diaminopimelate decarboxylase
MNSDLSPSFQFRNDILHVDDVAIPDIVATVGTPVYVYSRQNFERQYHLLETSIAVFGGQICYAVKANSNLAVLKIFNALGAGFDIVSGGELQRVMAAGADAGRVVFSGVGKSAADIDLALKLDIGCFNVESAAELARIAERARLLGKVAAVAIRVNPDVDPKTHPYISTGLKENKFGVPAAQALALYDFIQSNDHLRAAGLACHIGSQITTPQPMIEALENLLKLIDQLQDNGIELDHLDLGGGFSATYDTEPPFDFADYSERVVAALDNRKIQIVVEPGRFLVANGGILVTTVEYLKPQPSDEHHNFAVTDAAMNDLIRPALYQAWHGVDNVARRDPNAARRWDIVGPVCESADFLAKDRLLTIEPGDLLAVYSAGAYAMVQASNYNSRGRPPEVLVEGDSFSVIRRRETSTDMLRLELPER